MGKIDKYEHSETTEQVIEVLQSEKVSKDTISYILKILEKQDENIKIWLLLKEHIEKAKKFAVVIYEEQPDGREKPIYWSKKIEDMSGYTYEEIMARYYNWESIMELLYWHKPEQIEKIKDIFEKNKESGIWYENFVLSMKTAQGTLTEVAWNTERSGDNKYRMSFWSQDFTDIQKMLRMDDQLPCLKKSALKKDFRECVLNRRWKVEDAKHVLALALIDIDDFKSFNDSYGHSVWDHVLNEFVKFFNSKLRDWDHVYRLGWDEFGILFNTTKHDQIIDRVTRIKSEFNSINYIVSNWRVINSLKQPTYKDAIMFYENNKNSGTMIVLPPIWLSIWLSDFNYSAIRKISENPENMSSLLEDELEKLKNSTDDILGIAKYCYLLNNEQYKVALDTKWIVIDKKENWLIEKETWVVKNFAIASNGKKCKNFIWTPIFSEKWEIAWVNIITGDGPRELYLDKIKIIKRRKNKLYEFK